MSTHSAERLAAVKAGCKPVHFSLDGCPLSCYFSGNVATLRDTLSTSRSVGRGAGAFIYALSADETSPALVASRHTSTALFSCRFKHPCLPGGNGIFTATPTERITHYTLQAKSCAKWGLCPLWKPPQEKAVRYPSYGAHTAFSCLKAWLAAILRYFVFHT